MWFPSVLTRWFRTPQIGRSQQAGSRRPLRLTLDQLENRMVPTTFTASSVADLIADIHAANLQGGDNAIVLTANTPFTLTTVDNTTDGPTGLPVIAGKGRLTIEGNGDTIARSQVVGTPAFRLLDVAAGAYLTLENLTLQGGLASPEFPEGGAIYTQGTMRIDSCSLSGNSVSGFGNGGAIFNDQTGNLTIAGSTLSGNSASFTGGGILNAGTLVMMDHSILTANTAPDGGALANYGNYATTKLELDQTTLSDNSSTIEGGAIFNYSGTLSMNRCLVANNTAAVGGGILNGSAMTMRQCTLSDNAAVATLMFGPLYGGLGGGIYNFGTLDVEQCTLSGNTTSGNPALYPDGGGAICNTGTLTVSHSTFSGNSTDNIGGAIFNAGTLLINQSALVGNAAGTAGGGIISGGSLTVQQSTVCANSAPLGADLYNAGSATLLDSDVCIISNTGMLTVQ
jgi:hypothetical protein